MPKSNFQIALRPIWNFVKEIKQGNRDQARELSFVRILAAIFLTLLCTDLTASKGTGHAN